LAGLYYDFIDNIILRQRSHDISPYFC